eukprot:gene726-2514_t
MPSAEGEARAATAAAPAASRPGSAPRPRAEVGQMLLPPSSAVTACPERRRESTTSFQGEDAARAAYGVTHLSAAPDDKSGTFSGDISFAPGYDGSMAFAHMSDASVSMNDEKDGKTWEAFVGADPGAQPSWSVWQQGSLGRFPAHDGLTPHGPPPTPLPDPPGPSGTSLPPVLTAGHSLTHSVSATSGVEIETDFDIFDAPRRNSRGQQLLLEAGGDRLSFQPLSTHLHALVGKLPHSSRAPCSPPSCHAALPESGLLVARDLPDEDRSSMLPLLQAGSASRVQAEVMRTCTIALWKALLSKRDSSRQRGKMAVARSCQEALRELWPRMCWLAPSCDLPESSTGLLLADLHRYCIYSAQRRCSIILREVGPGAADTYEGVYHMDKKYCLRDGVTPDYSVIRRIDMENIRSITSHHYVHAQGKAISISLKSSPYKAILGMIPLDPNLSKLQQVHAGELAALEELILKNRTKRKMRKFLGSLRNQEGHWQQTLRKYTGEANKQFLDSNARLGKLWQGYESELQMAQNKLAVSRKWLGQFNAGLFLGATKVRTPTGLPIYYLVKYTDITAKTFSKQDSGLIPNTVVARDDAGGPIFLIQTNGQFSVCSSQDGNWEPVDNTFVFHFTNQQRYKLKPVWVATYRVYKIDLDTNRIVEDHVAANVIVPDYDGLSYAHEWESPVVAGIVSSDMSWEENIASMVVFYHNVVEALNTSRWVDGMGLVNDDDILHVHEMRLLTDWKQNHGAEMRNTVKPQSLNGPHIAFVPNAAWSILHGPLEIIQFYRWAWKKGMPLPLNPCWPVLLDEKGLPKYDPSFTPPDYKATLSELKDRIESEGDASATAKAVWASFHGLPAADDGKASWTLESIEKAYLEHCAAAPLADEAAAFSLPEKLKYDNSFREYASLRDEDQLYGTWIQVRLLELVPLLAFPTDAATRDAEQLNVPVGTVTALWSMVRNLLPQVRTELGLQINILMQTQLQILAQQRDAFYSRWCRPSSIKVHPAVVKRQSSHFLPSLFSSGSHLSSGSSGLGRTGLSASPVGRRQSRSNGLQLGQSHALEFPIFDETSPLFEAATGGWSNLADKSPSPVAGPMSPKLQKPKRKQVGLVVDPGSPQLQRRGSKVRFAASELPSPERGSPRGGYTPVDRVTSGPLKMPDSPGSPRSDQSVKLPSPLPEFTLPSQVSELKYEINNVENDGEHNDVGEPGEDKDFKLDDNLLGLYEGT